MPYTHSSTKNKVLSHLASWTDNRAKEYAIIAQQKDADKEMVESALDIVKEFIQKRNLILFGGLAIDYALRLEGSHIYPDGERPDFDFLSPHNVEDAYELADILHRKGFKEVGAIRALHVQTMRVRTNFIYVADIGYAPQAVFDKLPTLNYQGLRILHPDFQRIDMHLAFCFPFNGAPREDIFHRWQKDTKRFGLFEEKYPITCTVQEKFFPTKIVTRTAIPVFASDPSQLRVGLHGFVAYALLRKAYKQLSKVFDDAPSLVAPEIKVDFPDSRTISIESPLPGDKILIVSPEPEQVPEKMSSRAKPSKHPPEWRNPYMDIIPVSLTSGNLRVFSTRNRLLSATPIRISPHSFVYIVSPHYLLLYFLISSHLSDEPHIKNLYKNFYLHTLEILAQAERFFLQRIHSKNISSTSANELIALYMSSPFVLNTTTLGYENNEPTYFIKLASASVKIGNDDIIKLEKKINLEHGMSFEKILAHLPTSYFPANAKEWPSMNYKSNVLFQRDGSLMNET